MSRMRILLVEDDLMMVVMIRDILEATGPYQIEHAYDGVCALEMMGMELPAGVESQAREHGSEGGVEVVLPELVISDCMMPRMDGLTLVTQMSLDERVRGIPVIVLTTKAKMEEPFKQLPNVVGFMAKPLSLETFPKMVKAALSGGRA